MTFIVYTVVCCVCAFWFACHELVRADGTKSKQSVILLCVRSDLHLTEFATLGMYTSLKASAAMGKLWSSCCLLLLRDVSLFLGNGDRGATAQNKRRVIFKTASTTNFHSLLFRFVLSFAGLVVGFDLFALLLAFRTEFVFDIVC